MPVFGSPLLPDLSPLYSARQLGWSCLWPFSRKWLPGEAKGVYLLLEPINKNKTLPEYSYQGRVCESRQSSVRLLADIYHMNLKRIQLILFIERQVDAHVHLASSG